MKQNMVSCFDINMKYHCCSFPVSNYGSFINSSTYQKGKTVFKNSTRSCLLNFYLEKYKTFIETCQRTFYY